MLGNNNTTIQGLKDAILEGKRQEEKEEDIAAEENIILVSKHEVECPVKTDGYLNLDHQAHHLTKDLLEAMDRNFLLNGTSDSKSSDNSSSIEKTDLVKAYLKKTQGFKAERFYGYVDAIYAIAATVMVAPVSQVASEISNQTSWTRASLVRCVSLLYVDV